MNSVLKEESFEREVWDPPYDCYAAHSAILVCALCLGVFKSDSCCSTKQRAATRRPGLRVRHVTYTARTIRYSVYARSYTV